VRVESLELGSILDAQDYLDNWHLAIVVDEKKHPEPAIKQLHFLPFNKGNRDEEFNVDDSARLAPAFSRTEINSEPEASFNQLRSYYENFKLSKKQSNFLEERKSEESFTNGSRMNHSKVQSQAAAGLGKMGQKGVNRNISPLNELHSD
jgi:hypothetical protein